MAAAALVGWSRVHDNRHWTSGVVAGAALGVSVAAKTDRILRDRDRSRGLGLDLGWQPGGPRLAVTLRR